MGTGMNKRRFGQEKELLAAGYLKGRGYRILEHNFHSRMGEIDLVARDGAYLVFIEVKYRRDTAAGYPEEAVTAAKQGKIMQTAKYYLMVHGLPENTPCRFDVVAMTGGDIRLISNAFGAL